MNRKENIPTIRSTRPNVPPTEGKTEIKSDYVSKQVAAIEVLKWINPLRILAFLGIVLPFITISLCIVFLDVVALAIWCISAAFISYILVKATREKNYLEHTYNLRKPKPTYRLKHE